MKFCYAHKGLASVSACRALSLSQSVNKEAGHSEIKNVVVVGGGLMGAGVAQVAAQNDFSVTVVDSEDEYLQKCMVMIRKSLDRITKKKFPNEPKGAAKFIDDTFSKLKSNRNLAQAVEDADLVIEAITENMDVKKQLFGDLDKAAPEKTIFATNTSSLSVSDIAEATNRPEKVGGLHFFNPVPMMALVEVIRAKKTSDATLDALYQFSKDLGKNPVVCGDTPGFIVNRLLIPYMMEAIRFAERGHASTRDIDTAMRLGAGYPLGPFELADYVGLDTQKFIIDGWHEIEPDNPLFEPSATLDNLVTEGKLGRKTGHGFYKYGNLK